MPKNDQAPATRTDLQDLEQRIGKTTRKDLQDLEQRIDKTMEQMEVRLAKHFSVVAENLVHDFKGIFKDRLEQHEDRIRRLEQHAGLVSA